MATAKKETVKATTKKTPARKPKKKVPAKKKTPTKKNTKKKVPTKKTPKKKTTTTKKKATKKSGPRIPQIRILKALARNAKPLTRKQISEKAKVDLAWLNSYIGSNDEAIRAKNDKNIMPSLLTLGLVAFSPEEGPTSYTITAAGRKAVEKQ